MNSDFVCQNGFKIINQVFGKNFFKFSNNLHEFLYGIFYGLNFFLLSISNKRSEYTKLNVQYKPVNLGQGFSDAPPPPFVREALIATVTNPNYALNQYTRGAVSEIRLFINHRTHMCRQINIDLCVTHSRIFSVRQSMKRLQMK